jgi:adenylate cyclase
LKKNFLFIFSFFLISIYGGLVCPFIENLGYLKFSLQILGLFFFSFFLKITAKKIIKISIPKDLFFLEFFIFLIVGIAITAIDTIFYEFPILSGIKVTIVILFLGFFNGLDSYLREEYLLLQRKEQLINENYKPFFDNSISTVKRFVLVSTVSLLSCGVTIILVVAKDIPWILSRDPMYQKEASKLVLIELGFVTLGILFYILNLLYLYSKNLKLQLEYQKFALETVSKGINFDVFVPEITKDEFGQIAYHTNDMIRSLKEKKKIESILGKVLDPAIAKKLIKNHESFLEGTEMNLSIMMTDIRGFTSLSETIPPKELVNFLNEYFSEMVKIIQENGGIVDKFIGDGILAIFGIDSETNGINEAVFSAIEMQNKIKDKKLPNGLPLQIGIGIHYGNAIVGSIGAENRLEYTVIGDTVNTTSRLESATKDLSAFLVISKSVYEKLNLSVKSMPWKNRSDYKLKGKLNLEEIFYL